MFYNFLGKREQDDSNFMILTRMLQQDNSFVSFVAHPLCFLLRLYKGVPMLELHLMAIIIFVTINLMNYLPSIIVDLKLKKYAST